MIEKTFYTKCGDIHYWITDEINPNLITIVFLPGLTDDHRLFDQQIAYFENIYNVFVWDAPGHGLSWPFKFDFSIFDKAKWLDEILNVEQIGSPVIVGQSMGGCLGQAYIELFPQKLRGFISIDSVPLQRSYVSKIEIWLLKRKEWMCRYCPWKLLLKVVSNGAAVSDYGRKLMRDMIMMYSGDQRRYAQIAGHGYKILAEAIEADLPYEIDCHTLLICGKKDRDFSCIRYNKAWHAKIGIAIDWIENAGHNSNTDQPNKVNKLIHDFIESDPNLQKKFAGTSENFFAYTF